MTLTKWEYRRITLEPEVIDYRTNHARINAVLSEEGAEGWELVQLVIAPAFSFAFFKRPVQKSGALNG
jgi:hypothetical protein